MPVQARSPRAVRRAARGAPAGGGSVRAASARLRRPAGGLPYFTTVAPSGSASSASVAMSTLLPRASGLSGHSGT